MVLIVLQSYLKCLHNQWTEKKKIIVSFYSADFRWKLVEWFAKIWLMDVLVLLLFLLPKKDKRMMVKCNLGPWQKQLHYTDNIACALSK